LSNERYGKLRKQVFTKKQHAESEYRPDRFFWCDQIPSKS